MAKRPVAFQLWNRYFILLILINSFASLCNQFFNPTLSLHVLAIGGNTTQVGFLGTFMTVGSGISRIVGGKFSDKYGRMRISFAGLLLFCVASIVFLFVDTVPEILILRIFQGLGFGLCSTSLTASCPDVLPYHSMASGISYFGLSYSFAQTLGPSIAVALYYTQYGFSSVVVIGSAFLVIALLLTLPCKFEADQEFIQQVEASHPVLDSSSSHDDIGTTYHGIWKYFEKNAIPSGIVVLFGYLSFGVIMGFAVLYANTEHIARENAGLFFTVAAAGIVCSRLFAGRIVQKQGTLCALKVAFLSGIVGFSLLIFARYIHGLFFIAGAFCGLSNGLYQPALNSEAMFRTPQHRRGAASTTFMLPTEIGFSVSSLLAGLIVTYFNYTICWSMCIVFNIIALILSYLFFKPGSLPPASTSRHQGDQSE